MANTTYTVKWGDTLSEIAVKYNTTVSELMALNPDIKNADLIYVDQVIIISGTAPATSKNVSSVPVITQFGLQSNSTSIFATWKWDRSNTDHYEVKWLYDTGDGVKFVGTKSTTEEKQSLYSPPSNAKSVTFYVKAVSKTYNNTSYWTGGWSTAKTYYVSNNPPSAPPTPTVTITNYKLTAELSNLDINAKEIEFQIVKNDTSVYKTGRAAIKTSAASYSCTVAAGNEYKVRCRAKRDSVYGEWSQYTSNYSTPPSAPKSITKLQTYNNNGAVRIEWEAVNNATNYKVEYTTDKNFFDSSNQVQSYTTENNTTTAILTGLETGQEWFFRVQATNSAGGSVWSSIKSIKVGTKPAPPTTWSSTTTAIAGETITLYWVHNSEDGSKQSAAFIFIREKSYDDTQLDILHHINLDFEEDDETPFSYYDFNTSGDYDGKILTWYVRTKGVTDEFSDDSIERAIHVYARPTLDMSVSDIEGGPTISTVTSFPIYISGTAGPSPQQEAIGYHVSIISNETYETTDNVGNQKIVKAGEEIYSKHANTKKDAYNNVLPLSLELNAGNIDLENNISYKIIVTASMNSGLNAEATSEITVSWEGEEYWPNAEMSYDPDTYTMNLMPYCINSDSQEVTDVTMSIYRREFDGSFTEIGSGLIGGAHTFVTDPHPSLDFARYRIVVSDNATGKISYYDAPGYPIGEKAIIIQWDEKWSSYNKINGNPIEQPSWAGSLLRLPYNVDITDNNNLDVEQVKYIGREHPVTYYGTQLGVTSTWSTVIPKSDKETVYALRRLARWMGDVYVREPSGTGYWANISVSFSQKHLELTIPITLSITRVAGGV